MAERPTTRQPWYRQMTARDPAEEHRASTPLELLFDLCFVVAVAQAGGGLEHQVEAGHVGHGVVGYLTVFFAIWWAWMNFTWFASAYDTDDVPYRITVLVQIAGSLVLAAGVDQALEDDNFAVVTWGYVVMRLALVTQWLRAARSDPAHRDTALKYAAGITVVQIGWVLRLLLPPDWGLASFLVLVAAEMAVPAWAERGHTTTYHPDHIAERYGLFTVIVLGEAVTAAALAVKAGLDQGDHGGSVIVVAVMGLLILFSMWWLYFDRPSTEQLESLGRSLFWGYGHSFVFAGIAAVGAGLSLSVAHALPHPAGEGLDSLVAAAALTVPVAVFLLATTILRVGGAGEPAMRLAVPIAAVLVLAATFSPVPVQLTAAVLVALVVVMLVNTRERPRRVLS